MKQTKTVNIKKNISWAEFLRLSIMDLPTLASRINELTKECEQLVK